MEVAFLLLVTEAAALIADEAIAMTVAAAAFATSLEIGDLEK